MKRILLLLSAMFAFVITCAQQPLIQKGMTNFRIVYPAGTDSLEHLAGAEFQEYMGRIAGAENRRQGTDMAIVYIGRTRYVEQHYAKQLAQLRDDGFLVCSDGHDLVICGNTAKATLYGVYDFLEHHLGCRYYTPEAEFVPHLQEYVLEPFVEVKNPAFRYRETLYYYPNHSQSYADKHKLHNRQDLFRDWGMFVHTFQHLVPQQRYFAKHPEWFSEIDGHRMRDGQLCLSNPQVLEVLCQNLDSMMRAHPEKTIWSVSNNDNYSNCTCPACRHADSLYGGPSGTLIHFVNQVARRFPDKTISTLGYQFTRRPPQLDCPDPQHPDSNVNIMFCSIECDRHLPIATNPVEKSFRNDMEGWGSLTNNIFMWDYIVQFRNFMDPFPNLHVLQSNLQYFHDHGVRMMFEQGTGEDNKTAWMELRTYLIAKLMWNPDEDVDSLIHDFCQGYYGAGSCYVERILDDMTLQVVRSKKRLEIYGYPIDAKDTYLKYLEYYETLMDSAFAVSESVEETSRLWYFHLSLDFAALEMALYEALPGYSFFADSAGVRVLDSSWVRRADAFLQGCKVFGVEKLHEMGYRPEEFRADIERFCQKAQGNSLARGCKVTLAKPFDARYDAGGAQSLTDGKSGILNYQHNWLGFYGNEVDATVDLGVEKKVSEISMDFFFYPLSWIFEPKQVTFYVSNDGKNWSKVGSRQGDNPQNLATPEIKHFGCHLDKTTKVRYVRVVAESLPKIPDWHRAAGNPVWLFTDEIVVR